MMIAAPDPRFLESKLRMRWRTLSPFKRTALSLSSKNSRAQPGGNDVVIDGLTTPAKPVQRLVDGLRLDSFCSAFGRGLFAFVRF
jgi:hypothetical protein